MHPELIAHASRQGGVFTRAQALEAGLTGRSIRHLTRQRGECVIVRRGVYAERNTWDSLERWTARPLAEDWAAHLAMREKHVLSHDSAGRAYGLSLLRANAPLVHITRPGVGGCRTDHGVKHHLSQGLPWLSSFASGLPVTPLARTALDIAREHGLWSGVAAVDSALRKGASLDDFARALGPMRQWPHITTSRLCVQLGDPGADNAGESMSRLLVKEVVAEQVQTQYPIRLTDGRVVWVDLIVGNHVVEFDGRAKYQRSDDETAVADPGETVWNEKDRQRLICAEGLGVSRIIWADFWGAARATARDRLTSELAITRARFGSRRPPHLDEVAHRMAHVRQRRLRGPTAAGSASLSDPPEGH